MSFTKRLIDDSVEYGEVDPPYYEDMWPSEEELEFDERSDFDQ